MKINEVVKLAFNPEESQDKEIIKIFKNRTAKILWCLIKTGHITNQYFNSDILKMAERINPGNRNNAVISWEDFMKTVRPLSAHFGCTYAGPYKIPDTEFWGGIYGVIIGNPRGQANIILQIGTETRYL